MNIQKVFEAIKSEPDQPTLIVAALEFERQGYSVTIGDKYDGSRALLEADERDELNLIPLRNGVKFKIAANKEVQTFRLQLLDVDTVCFTDVDSPPVIYDPEATIGFFKSGKTN
jgi:hypothetical protein